MHFIFLELSRLSQMNRWRLMMYRRMLSVANPRLNNRRVWVWPRPQHWFQLLLTRRDMDPLWKLHFRVTPPYLRSYLWSSSYWFTKATHACGRRWVWRKGWPCRFGDLQQGIVLKPVDCSLGWENPPQRLYVVSSKMLLSAVKTNLSIFHWPEETQEKMNGFIDEYGIPQTVGAIDGCHIEINAPPQ